jgi:hypothetical protein
MSVCLSRAKLPFLISAILSVSIGSSLSVRCVTNASQPLGVHAQYFLSGNSDAKSGILEPKGDISSAVAKNRQLSGSNHIIIIHNNHHVLFVSICCSGKHRSGSCISHDRRISNAASQFVAVKRQPQREFATQGVGSDFPRDT